MATRTVDLKPVKASKAYAVPHTLNVSKANDAGKPITFTAEESGFGIAIPRNSEGDLLFVADTPVSVDPWDCSIRPLTERPTPNIKASSDLTVGDEWVYHVYCETTQDWVNEDADAPPRIIIVD